MCEVGPLKSPRGTLVASGGLVADDRRPRIKGQRLQASIDDRAVLGRAAHHRRPHIKARLEGLGRLAVVVAVLPEIGVHEDVAAALQLGIEPSRRVELEAAGAGPGSQRASAPTDQTQGRATSQVSDPAIWRKTGDGCDRISLRGYAEKPKIPFNGSGMPVRRRCTRPEYRMDALGSIVQARMLV